MDDDDLIKYYLAFLSIAVVSIVTGATIVEVAKIKSQNPAVIECAITKEAPDEQ